MTDRILEGEEDRILAKAEPWITLPTSHHRSARTVWRGIVLVRESPGAKAYRLAAVAGWYSVAQMILGFLAIAPAWYVCSTANVSGAAKWVSGGGFVVGVMVLLLTLLLV
jgi:hypothetical protein